MSNRAEPFQPRNSITEQAKLRKRKPAKIWDFTDLVDGKRKKRRPAYFRRSDGQYLFYHGKENAIYGETEAGKDMILAELVIQSVDQEMSVAWIDFEEGDEIDCGSRLLQLGMETEFLRDQTLFRFSTPEDVDEARDCVHDAITCQADIIILNGIQAAYALFGWDLNDPDSTRRFRNEIIKPCLNSGRTVIETDHLNKSSTTSRSSNGSRYASGGMAKLNWVSGAAYLLRAKTPIVQGGQGKSELILTKDRPGGVKPSCSTITNEARMMYAGTLHVKSSGSEDDGWSLQVDIAPPHPEAENHVMVNGSRVQVELIERILELYKDYGVTGVSKNIIEKECRGVSTVKIRAAIEVARAHGCLVFAKRTQTSKTMPLRYQKSWNNKLGVSKK
jgi:hypothetical protein